MSKARDIIDGKSESEGLKWYNWCVRSTTTVASYGSAAWGWSYANARVIGWFVVTTGMITLVPLLFEVKREGLIEELERLQIGRALAEGQTPQDLAMQGLTSAIEPKVLK